MIATLTFSPDPNVGMSPIAEIIRHRLEPLGLRVIALDPYQATVEGEFDAIVEGLRSLDGHMLRRAGRQAIVHVHIHLSEFDDTDPQVSAAYDEVCGRFLHPYEDKTGAHGTPL